MKKENNKKRIKHFCDSFRGDMGKIITVLLCFAVMLACIPLSASAGVNALDAITIASFAPIDPIHVELGTSGDELSLPETVSATTVSGGKMDIPVTSWDDQGLYNANVAGRYSYTANIASLMASGVTLPVAVVTVMPDANAVSEKGNSGTDNNAAAENDGQGGVSLPLETTLLGEAKEVNVGTTCKLTPMKTECPSGETVNFMISTQYSDPGSASAPTTVTIGIPLPETHPAIQLPGFNRVGTASGYEGVPMYSLSFNGNTVDFYDVTSDDGSRRIEYTLHAGDTIQGVLPLLLPNGITEGDQTITLTPEIISSGNYQNVTMTPGTSTVKADFGWKDVTKVGSADSIGTTDLGAWDHDRITYTIAADSASSGLATGRVFTDHYELSDTLLLNGLYYADGVLTSTESGGVTSFFVGGVKVLEVDKPSAGLSVDKVMDGEKVVGFTLHYRALNTTLGDVNGGAKELPNISMNASLILGGMQVSSTGEDASVVNTANFKAYSPFYDEENDKTGSEYYHESTAEYSSFVRGNCTILKEAFEDADCTTPMPSNYSGSPASFYYKLTAKNLGSTNTKYVIEDVLPQGLTYADSYTTDPASPAPTFSQTGNRLQWSDIDIETGESYSVVVKVDFDEVALGGDVHMLNVANLYNGSGVLMADDDVTIRYLAGETTDAEIEFEKSVNRNYGGVGDSLTYTITAQNTAASPKLTTIVDNWPGDKIYPTKVTGCEYFTLLDDSGTEYTLEQVAADTSIVITKIKFYNIYLPAKGKKSVTVTGVITNTFEELENTVGNGTDGSISAKAYGVRLAKEAYAYDDTTGVGNKLTNTDVVSKDDTICYKLTATNFKTSEAKLNLVDVLPSGLTPVNGSINGITGQLILQRESEYSNLGWADTSTHTSNQFTLDPGKTAYIYLFVNVSQAAVDTSFSNSNKITNSAYLEFPSGIKTGTATADVFTYVDETISAFIDKTGVMVANYNDDLTFIDTGLLERNYNNTPVKSGGAAWLGAYMGYSVHIGQTNLGNAAMPVYELQDDLPPGMEFVGIAMSGDKNFFNFTDMTGKLIGNGESGVWSNGDYSQTMNCDYDPATRQLTITFGDRGSGSPLMVPAGSASNTYFNILVKVTERRPQFLNNIKMKVDKEVNLATNGFKGKLTTSITDDEMRYINNSFAAGLIDMTPGIEKKLLGHYAGSSALNPDNTMINPGESLRFAVYVTNQDNSKNNNINFSVPRAYIKDFVVTDILPAEYVYKTGSAKLTLNALYTIADGQEVDSTLKKQISSFEPQVEQLSDGRWKLTWTFSGYDMRLLNIGGGQRFTHIITYDTDWNPNFIETYGSYTNTATVKHSYDFDTVSVGSPDYDDNSISASAVVSVYGSAGSAAVKAVTAKSGTAYGNAAASGNNLVVIDQGETVNYTLCVKNSTSESSIQSLVIIDELPRADNDTGVVNRIDRGSEFDMLFGSSPNVSVALVYASGLTTSVNPDQYTVEYGMSTGGLNSSGDWSYGGTGGRVQWGANSNGKNAIKIAFLPSFSIAAGESILVNFDANSPSDADVGSIAWNSFGYSYQSNNETDGLSERIYSEPEKVGVQMPGAKLSITKKVNGDPAPSAAEFTFVLKKNGVPMPHVKYRLNGEYTAYYTGEDGCFKLKAGDSAVLNVPPGAGYTYTLVETEMPDNFTFTDMLPATKTDGTVKDDQFIFKDNLAQNETVGVTFTNTYKTPPTIDVPVNKVWVGDTEADRPTDVRVQLYKQSSASETPAASGDPVTLNKANGWKYTWEGLASSSKWTVKEVSPLPIGYSSIVTGDQVNGFVVTNNYERPMGSLTVSKTVTGTDADTNKLFNFTFTFSGNAGYAYYGSKTGIIVSGGSIQLKHGESVTIAIPKDVEYSVVEEAVDGYTTTPSNRVVSGTIGLAGQTAAFVNTLAPVVPPEPVETGNLSIKKTVTGSDSDTTKDFVFTITFNAQGVYNYTGSKTGTISSGGSISLHHGQMITILGLPAGTSYTVTESDNTGYRVSSTGESGVIVANVGVTAAFVNNRGGTMPKTGGDNDVLYGALIMAASALCMALDAAVSARRRARKRR